MVLRSAVVLLLVASLPAACGGSGDDAAGDADAATSDATSGSSDASPEVAASLDGLRWDLPCVDDTSAELCTTGETVVQTATVAGTSGVTYDIEVRFRGIVEPKTYTGGSRDGFFQTGGAPSGDTANIYQLDVSAPEQVYFINAGVTRTADQLYCEPLDYTTTIQAATGATVTLTADPLDALQIQNRDADGEPIIVEGVPPAPDPFDGQFVQMDVVSVSAP